MGSTELRSSTMMLITATRVSIVGYLQIKNDVIKNGAVPGEGTARKR